MQPTARRAAAPDPVAAAIERARRDPTTALVRHPHSLDAALDALATLRRIVCPQLKAGSPRQFAEYGFGVVESSIRAALRDASPPVAPPLDVEGSEDLGGMDAREARYERLYGEDR